MILLQSYKNCPVIDRALFLSSVILIVVELHIFGRLFIAVPRLTVIVAVPRLTVIVAVLIIFFVIVFIIRVV